MLHDILFLQEQQLSLNAHSGRVLELVTASTVQNSQTMQQMYSTSLPSHSSYATGTSASGVSGVSGDSLASTVHSDTAGASTAPNAAMPPTAAAAAAFEIKTQQQQNKNKAFFDRANPFGNNKNKKV